MKILSRTDAMHCVSSILKTAILKIFLLAPLWGWGLYAQDSTKNVTADDIQKLRTETYKIFELYEAQLLICQQTKEAISLVTKTVIDQNLKELDRIRTSIFESNITLDRLKTINADLLKEIAALKKSLRKIKRRAWLERTISTAIIGTMTYFLITQNPDPP